MTHVFISYSTQNSDYAYQLADKLREEGFDIWIDNRELRSSDNWWEFIVRALRGCAAFIVIMTPEARESKWVQREVTLADQWNKPTFPILLWGDNWEIFVLTQFEKRVKLDPNPGIPPQYAGKLPPADFYDKLADHAPRTRYQGENVVQVEAAADEVELDDELAEEIANPPPVTEATPLFIEPPSQYVGENVVQSETELDDELAEEIANPPPVTEVATPLIEPPVTEAASLFIEPPLQSVADVPSRETGNLSQQPPPAARRKSTSPPATRDNPVRRQPMVSRTFLMMASLFVGLFVLGLVAVVLINASNSEDPTALALTATFIQQQNATTEILLSRTQAVSLTIVSATLPSLTLTPIPSSSPTAEIAFVTDRDGNQEIYLMNTDGSNPRNLSNNAANDFAPAWSPDGTQIAFVSDRGGRTEIYVMNADGSDIRRLTNNSITDWDPVWSPDGKEIVYFSNTDKYAEIYVMNADGSNVCRLTNNLFADMDPAWSPDGSQIAFSSNRDGNDQIYTMNADGSNVRRVENTTADDTSPTWSPNGTWIAFTSALSGYPSYIDIMFADGAGVLRLNSTPNGEGYPAWSPDGSQIAYISLGNNSFDLYIVDANGTNPHNVTNDVSDERYPAWRPNPKT